MVSMYKFPTVKEIIEQLQQFPPDAEVHIGHLSAFLEDGADGLNSTKGRITDKEAYTMYPADNAEYGDFYEDAWNSNPRGWFKRTCVIISTG